MKKIIIITICLLLLLVIWQNAQASELLLDYPEIKGTTPTSEGLPGFIKYIYLFALGAAGFVALLAILFGAIMYIFSAGNPSKAADAKNRILSALLGILILLASVLILETINPDLVNIGFTLPEIKPSKAGCYCSSEQGLQGCFFYNQCATECQNICGVGNYVCSVNAPECQ